MFFTGCANSYESAIGKGLSLLMTGRATHCSGHRKTFVVKKAASQFHLG